MIARIIRIVSKQYLLKTADGQHLNAIVLGRVRLQTSPVTGDLIEASFMENRWVIEKILPRHTYLERPAAANIDQALIVMSVKEPLFSAVLIDRLCFLIVHAGIEPLLCVTKMDLGMDAETEQRLKEYQQGPMKVICCAKDHLDPSLSSVLNGHITVLTGQSGAGKSTLLNHLDPSFHLETQSISKSLGRGKHTTRHTEMHEIAGGLVADTPGFSSLDFSKMDEVQLAQSVREFQPYLGRCRFNDCHHQAEPGCAVKQAVEEGKIPKTRYENYLAILKLIQNRKEKYL